MAVSPHQDFHGTEAVGKVIPDMNGKLTGTGWDMFIWGNDGGGGAGAGATGGVFLPVVFGAW